MSKTVIAIWLILALICAIALVVLAVEMRQPAVTPDKVQPILANGPTANTVAENIRVVAPGIQEADVNITYPGGIEDRCHLFYYPGDTKAPMTAACSWGVPIPK